MTRTRRSVVWAEPPFECPCNSVSQWPVLADCTHSSPSPIARRRRTQQIDPKQTNVESLSWRRFPRTQQPFVDHRCLRSSRAPSRCPGTNRNNGTPTHCHRSDRLASSPNSYPFETHGSRHLSFNCGYDQIVVIEHCTVPSQRVGPEHSPDPPALRNEVLYAANPIALLA